VIKAEADAIAKIPVNDAYRHAVEELAQCKGTVISTGIGKAGHVARKFAATLSSTGTPAVYIHPGEAAHGDLGAVRSCDIIVALSTSGKSLEVVEMLELSKKLEVSKVIGITSHPDSRLRELSDIILDMGEIEEPCRLKLTPTASVAVMLAITDAIALTLMDLRGFTKEEYGLRHHGGYLGKMARLPAAPTPGAPSSSSAKM